MLYRPQGPKLVGWLKEGAALSFGVKGLGVCIFDEKRIAGEQQASTKIIGKRGRLNDAEYTSAVNWLQQMRGDK